MRPPTLPLPAALRRRLLANYAWPREGRLAGLAFRLASAQWAHASRVCARECAERLRPRLAQEEEQGRSPVRVLEIGCGAGHGLAELRRLEPRRLELLGADVSCAALELAGRRLQSSVRLFQCGADDLLAVGTGTCQAVMDANCYPAWSPALSRVCAEAFRVLAPAGRLVSAADCEFAALVAGGAGVAGARLLEYLTALEAAGFVRVWHRRAACPDTGRPVHLITADAPA